VDYSRGTKFLFAAALFVATFEKLHWEVGGTIRLADVVALLFVPAFVWDRIRFSNARVPRTVAILTAFFGAFLLVYLAGFYNLQTHQAALQFGKGIVTFVIHFAFLVAGVAYLAHRGAAVYGRALGWFVAGIACNAAYGLLQLAVAQAGGRNLDRIVLSPLTGGASSINIYGAVNGAYVYRPNALTGDPNHLAIVLLIPLLVLLPIYLRLEPGHRRRLPLAALLGFLLLTELATLSRSGILGLVVGLLVLVFPYRRLLVSGRSLALLGGVSLLLAVVVLRRLNYFETVVRSRLHTQKGTSVHFGVYEFIPQVLHAHPLLGLGFNNFSVYYEFVTGKTDWGPHSFYVALFVETGLVGAALFAVFLGYLFRRLHAARALGRELARNGDPLSARVRPLAWGLTAALVATMAANAFYLTMTFDYFFVFAVLVLAAPLVFSDRVRVPSSPAWGSSGSFSGARSG